LQNSLILLDPIGDKYDSHARWAGKPSGDLVIFVHGFLGHSLLSWHEFSNFLDRPSVEQIDFVFYGHNGGRTQIEAHVSALWDFVELLWEAPERVDSYPTGRPGEFRYRKIRLCGHSRGGVLVRAVTSIGLDRGKTWAKQVRLLLFAPAHKGISSIPELVFPFGRMFGLIGQLAERFFEVRYPAVRDLRVDSRFLCNLEKRAIEQGLRADAVIFGSEERVVEMDCFGCDLEPCITIPDKDHNSICKPIIGEYEEPFEHVTRLRNGSAQ
jgi:hypothetical protein